MKACLLRNPAPVDSAPLALEELETPQPNADEIVVEVAACAVCRTDLHVVEGELARAVLPIIPGHQVVGRVAARGAAVSSVAVGQRVGVAWLHSTCGRCRFCLGGAENLCEKAVFTGWTVNGGFATHCRARADYVYPLPDDIGDIEAAPLLCAGIIGYRALRLCGVRDWRGARLGLYGFGAAGHIAIQLARARGAEVYVGTRDQHRHGKLAAELGAAWVGDATRRPPVALDAAIIFAPAGELVPAALAAIDRGGTVVLGGIHGSPIPSLPYALIYGERVVRSVTNNTRDDGRAFLAEAAAVGVRTHTEAFDLTAANEALQALKHGAVRGAAVLTVAS
ncbi:MAG TPA: zinc-dependent alcohol dehydrogenase family protein [Polyangia bacterium]|jgi:propanol-preferring alcohol dehydrogenase|nr:zinc-dependent alcohol dehydrogenase family protein [Polyangia bacterium]